MALNTPARSVLEVASTRCVVRISSSSRRSLHTTLPRCASILFALQGLSNSRETQHFNKLSRLNRIEHSPSLKLIKASEVDPYPLPTPPAPRPLPLPRLDAASVAAQARIWDERALRLGRAVLAEQARSVMRLQMALAKTQAREAKLREISAQDRLTWDVERKKFRDEQRTAGILVLLSVATATVMAAWRFWPAQEAGDMVPLSEKLARRTKAAFPLPAAVMESSTPSPAIASVNQPGNVASAAPIVPPPGSAASEVTAFDPHTKSEWWRSLFWKQ